MLAYVDPGSGMLAWQLIVAGFVGLLFYLKKILGFFGKVGRKILRKE